MKKPALQNAKRRLGWFLATTCLTSVPVLVSSVSAQDIDEIGTDLGSGADKGTVAGGTINVSGAPDVRGVGVSTGTGSDKIENTGPVDVDVMADESVVFSGLGMFQDGADVRAEGIGLFGDNGRDELVNTGEIDVLSVGAGQVVNLGLNLFGAFNFNAPSTADAFSTGIDGGNGADVIDNRGSVIANSIANLSMVGQNPSSFEQDAVVAITSNATTVGIRGTRNKNQTLNRGALVLGADASVFSGTLDIEIVNGVVVDSSTNANATVIGMEGDTIRDWLTNSGAITGIANANTTRGSFAISLSDGGIGDNALNPVAVSTGLWGGMSDDELFNTGSIAVSSGATASSTSVEINLIDIAGGTFHLAPEATSVGMDGGDHDDLLDNSGSIMSTATSQTNSNSVNLSLVDATVIGGRISAGFDSGGDEESEVPVQATAIGLAGGDGEDRLINRDGGDITLTGEANADSVTVSVAAIGVPDAAFQAIVEGESLASLDTFASSRIIAMTGGARDDLLTNYGDITGMTISDAQQVGVAVSAPAGFLPDPAGFLPGFTLGGAGAGAWADALGMSGDDGEDNLFNTGLIDLTSTADALAVGVSVELPDLTSSDGAAFDLSLTLADVVTDSDAFATGMAGGAGDDVLINAENGEVLVDAAANAASTGVGVTASFENMGVISEGVVVRASTDANADATAIDGGDGDDEIVNDGTADATAMADASTVGVAVALDGVASGGAAGVAAVDGSANANAKAQAITGGPGADLLINNGALGADATADASATGVSVALTGAQMGGFAGGGTLSITGATATADASGVDWSSNDRDAENRGSIETTATANAVGDSVSIGVSGTMAGFTLNASLADSSTIAAATASAFDAPSGDHAITNFETLSAISNATADSDSIGAELGVAVEGGLAAGVALTRTVTEATATSTGVISNVGVDDIANLGTINADATADVSSTSLAIGLNGTLAGVAINAAAADGSSMSNANATGISTGFFDDSVMTVGSLMSKADAAAHADSIAVEIAAAVEGGLAAGAALARGNVTADANATGAAAGGGADQLGAAGVVDVMAISSADADAVSVAMQGTAAGLTLGGAIVEAATTSTANASALNAGAGDDMVENTGTLAAMSMADASSTSVGVEIGASGAGISGGLALADTSADATAVTAAIEGGLGADAISNTSAIDADAMAEASGASVSVALAGSLSGASLGVALTDATVDANAYATGIAGDDAARPEEEGEDGESEVEIAETGPENGDEIVNAGAVMVDSVAKSSGASVSVAAPVSFVPVGFALATAENTAKGDAYGVDGGFGDDAIFNMGDLTVTSDVDVAGASVAASVSILALGGFDGKAFSNAYGMAGGFGDDILLNDATIMSNAMADAGGVTVALNLLGGSAGDLDTRADADAFGMFGGSGADIIVNESDIFADAAAHAASTNVALTLTGATVGAVSTKAFADATGIGGGDRGDIIDSSGALTATSLAETPTVSIALAGTGAVFNDATTRSETKAYGVDGGAGDDEIVTSEAVTATSTAKTTGVGVSVALIGGGTANVSTHADADAIGVAGGAGADQIVNQTALVSTATSTATSTGVNVNIVGAAFADGDSESTSNAAGISGGADNDVILNEGVIVATSTAANAAGAVSVSLGGLADGDVSTTATANAAGVEGGDGDDAIGHAGSITTTTTATANAQTVTVGAIGAGLGDIRLTANANAFGIDGGAGNDEIIAFENSTVDVNANISGNANNTTVQLVGGTAGSNVFGFTPNATGFAAGDGDDLISLHGTGDIDAASTFTLNNTAVSLIGVAFDDSGITSSPTATGVSAGAGDDVVYVGDLLDARAVNTFSMSGLSVNLAGYSSSRPTVGGTSTAIGVDLGDGADTLLADHQISANASSTNTVSGNQVTILGANQSTAQTGAVSMSAGVLGGGGADMLLTNGITDVDAAATANLNSLGFSLVGASIADGAVAASATGVGYDAGTGDDVAGNNGAVFVDTTATLTTSGNSSVGIGGAVSSASTTSTASSSGMLGGDGDDFLFNTDFIRARSNASGIISRTNYAFIGGSNASATANATATSLGIGGGEGDDEIENFGGIEVRATSATEASGNTTAAVGGAKASSTVSATARGIGIAGDNGDDFIKNFGGILVAASANPESTNAANTGGLFTDGVTNSRTITSTRVIGVNAGAGNNDVWNTGDILIQTLGLARTDSRSKGDILDNIFGLNLDARATATSSNNGQDARGVSAGDEATTLYNDGGINVAIRGAGSALANADGDAIVDGDGTATATVGVSDANAYGFIAGHGGNTLINSGNIIVLARPTGNADAISDADGIEATSQPDSRATANVSLNRVRAAGVWLGDGADMVVNEGLIDVTSAPQANQAEADAGFGGDVLGIDSFATATATANSASAYGIRAGAGENAIHNTGVIIARALPKAVANADARGVGFDGDATANATANARNALAVGIETGGGDDFVWNEGAITAISNPSVSTSSNRDTGQACIGVGELKVCENGEAGGSDSSSVSGRSAVAVTTGGGGDVLVNEGTITASIGNGSGNGEAISLAAGNDMLALLDGSAVLGSISLGAGNDTLMLSGVSTANSTPDGDGGTDALMFDGAGSFNRGFSSFESAVKFGDGAFVVPSLPSVSSLVINRGTLQSTASYAFHAGGVYGTIVHGSGDHGRFATSGTATLAGAVDVADGGGLYTDGQTFDIVRAASVGGAFASETLPEATPLLSFDLVQFADRVQVVASAASFASVASSGDSDQAFASQLDVAALAAKGALADHLARLQHLPAGADFESNIAQMNPARFDEFGRETAENIERFESGARQRLASLRRLSAEGETSTGFVRGVKALRFAETAQSALDDGVLAGAWKAEFGAADNAVGESRGSVTGVDYLLPSGAVIGASVGATKSFSLLTPFTGEDGRADNFAMSFYASRPIGENQYLDGVVTYGRQAYEASLPLFAGERLSLSPSEHNGRTISASLETGRSFAFAGGRSELFGGLRYESVAEERFDAMSLGNISYNVDRKDSHGLEGEVGMRVGWELETPAGAFAPRFSVSWNRRLPLTGDYITAAFADAPGFLFTLPSALRNENELRFGAGFDLWASKNVSVSARAESDLLALDTSVDGIMELKIGF